MLACLSWQSLRWGPLKSINFAMRRILRTSDSSLTSARTHHIAAAAAMIPMGLAMIQVNGSRLFAGVAPVKRTSATAAQTIEVSSSRV